MGLFLEQVNGGVEKCIGRYRRLFCYTFAFVHTSHANANDANLTETVTDVYNWCVRLWLPQAAAQGSEACLSLDGSDGGGFTLTLPIRGINLFSLSPYLSHFTPRSPISCRLLAKGKRCVRAARHRCSWRGCGTARMAKWRADVGMRTLRWCPVTQMGADGSKNRKVSWISGC